MFTSMTRCIRKLNSVNSLLRHHHLIAVKNLTHLFHRTNIVLPISPPPLNRSLVSLAADASSSSRRKVDPPTTMDPSSPPPTTTEPEIVTASGEPALEDFVHIENSKSAANPDENFDPNAGNSSEQLRSDSGSVDNGGGNGEDEEEKVVLSEELMKNVMVLNCESTAEGGSCDVYLVGTVHVSKESCREVQAVISALKPQVVFLELCSSREAVLTQNLKFQVPTMGDMLAQWKKKQNMFGILYSWYLAKVASKLEVSPGFEFRVAYEEAMKYGGKVILGDRPVHITLRRTWEYMPLWHKVKLVYLLLFQGVFLPSSEVINRLITLRGTCGCMPLWHKDLSSQTKFSVSGALCLPKICCSRYYCRLSSSKLKEMDDVDMVTLVMQKMSKQFPTLMETLVHERDKYMSSELLKVATEQNLVVAVVGKGHLQGIKKHWKQPIEVTELLAMPTRKPTITAAKILTFVGVAVAGVAIISGL